MHGIGAVGLERVVVGRRMCSYGRYWMGEDMLGRHCMLSPAGFAERSMLGLGCMVDEVVVVESAAATRPVVLGPWCLLRYPC